jgi:hypothetical protein
MEQLELLGGTPSLNENRSEGVKFCDRLQLLQIDIVDSSRKGSE